MDDDYMARGTKSLSESEITAFLEDFSRCKVARKKWEKIAEKTTAFYFGDQWSQDVRSALEAQKRPPAVFNMVLPAVDLIVGHQAQNRIDFVASPVDQYSDPDIADVLTTGIKHIEEDNNATFERRFQFLDGLITGVGVTENWLDTEYDVDGRVRVEQTSPWHFYFDTDFEKYDYRDAKVLFKEAWMDGDQIQRIFGKSVWKRVKSSFLQRVALPENEVSSTWAHNPTNDYGNLGLGKAPSEYSDSEMHGMGYNRKENKYRVIERYECRYEPVDFFYTTDGELIREDEFLDEEDREFSSPAFTRNIKHIHLTTLIGHGVVGEDKALPNDEWHQLFNFFFPYFVNGKYMGVIENVIYPQEELNKAHSSMLHILSTMTHPRFLYEDGAIDKEYESDIENTLGIPGAIIKFQELYDKETGQPKFHVEKPVEPPQAYYQVIASQSDNAKYITGATDAIQGSSRRGESGKAKLSDIQQAAVRLTGIIDNFRETQRLCGKAELWWIQHAYTEERWIRIRGADDGVNANPQELVINQRIYGVIANDVTVGRYDVVLKMEGKTKTERERLFFNYTELARVLGPEYGPVFAELALRVSDIPGKEEIVARIEQIRQAQMQQAQAAMMPQQQGAPRGGIQSAPRPGRGIRRPPAGVQA